MADQKTKTVYESATSRARVLRQGEITQIVIDGGGALVCETMEFVSAQKWAASKPSSGNLLTDRGRFLERITVLISRPGSLAQTRGSDKQLRTLAKLMKQNGYDLPEWNLPPELRNMKPGDSEADKKAAADQKTKLDAAISAGTTSAARSGAAPDAANMDDPYAGLKK